MKTIENIRQEFINLKNNNFICEDGNYEIINSSFIANEETIFGKLNKDYIKAELEWYLSQSLYINDIAGKVPEIWKQVADREGKINSNHGWCIFSPHNFYQFRKAVLNLKNNKFSRQGTMIYNRPTIHEDAIENGRKDFICTYSTQLLIRNNKLHYLVYMRSNDAIYGYKNDRYWHDHVFDLALKSIHQWYPDVEKGDLYWNAASLHIYPNHFHLIK